MPILFGNLGLSNESFQLKRFIKNTKILSWGISTEANRDYGACGIIIGGEDMSQVKEKDIEEIRRVVEKEFPEDPALQQVHIARKIIAKEAESEGLSFLEYIKLLRRQVKNV